MIPYGRQDIDGDDLEAVRRVLVSDWLTTGPSVEQFERDLAVWTGGVPVVAVSSGTAALHIAYFAAGIGPGDEVITPPITFVATQATAVHLGATPVFADVSSDTANIDPAAVEAAITPRTAAIVAVDYAGHPADMDSLRSIANKNGLLLIEDAAHSLGSQYNARAVGSLADITTFSFFPTKNITTGEGGAVAALDPNILERARRFSHQGLIRDPELQVLKNEGPWHQEVSQFGLNYRLPDILAALGSQQLKRLREFKVKRARLKALYDSLLADDHRVITPVQRPNTSPTWHLYALRVPAAARRSVFEGLRASGVGVQVNYLPAYRHPAFRSLSPYIPHCPVAESFYAAELSLPLWPGLPESTVRSIAYKVRALINNAENDTAGPAGG